MMKKLMWEQIEAKCSEKVKETFQMLDNGMASQTRIWFEKKHKTTKPSAYNIYRKFSINSDFKPGKYNVSLYFVSLFYFCWWDYQAFKNPQHQFPAFCIYLLQWCQRKNSVDSPPFVLSQLGIRPCASTELTAISLFDVIVCKLCVKAMVLRLIPVFLSIIPIFWSRNQESSTKDRRHEGHVILKFF